MAVCVHSHHDSLDVKPPLIDKKDQVSCLRPYQHQFPEQCAVHEWFIDAIAGSPDCRLYSPATWIPNLVPEMVHIIVMTAELHYSQAYDSSLSSTPRFNYQAVRTLTSPDPLKVV